MAIRKGIPQCSSPPLLGLFGFHAFPFGAVRRPTSTPSARFSERDPHVLGSLVDALHDRPLTSCHPPPHARTLGAMSQISITNAGKARGRLSRPDRPPERPPVLQQERQWLQPAGMLHFQTSGGRCLPVRSQSHAPCKPPGP